MTVFNNENTAWKEGRYPLFLGQAPALYDSVNVTYPEIFDLYKKQKAADWSEDEIDLSQSRIDMLTCPPETKDIMVKNLALQWEVDSIAARSIAPLFAPFITNSEYWAALNKVGEIEVLHALTYSEITRQCIPNPQDIFNEIMANDEIMARISPVSKAFSDLKRMGALYSLDMATKEEAYPVVMTALVALYCLERLQFMASFAATFAVVEQGYFQGIGKLVQKIMQDERFIHAELGRVALQIELETTQGQEWLAANRLTVEALVAAVVQSEYDWAAYLFSDGRKVVGLNEALLRSWVDYNAQDVQDVLGIEHALIAKTPLKMMDNWLDMDKTQNAQQEADSANYNLNIIVDDLGDDVIEF